MYFVNLAIYMQFSSNCKYSEAKVILRVRLGELNKNLKSMQGLAMGDSTLKGYRMIYPFHARACDEVYNAPCRYKYSQTTHLYIELLVEGCMHNYRYE